MSDEDASWDAPLIPVHFTQKQIDKALMNQFRKDPMRAFKRCTDMTLTFIVNIRKGNTD